MQQTTLVYDVEKGYSIYFIEETKMGMMIEKYLKTAIEQKLLALPIMEYAWISVDAIPFSKRVRSICETECPQYGKSWSCPPAVGTVEECRDICGSYEDAFVFTTIAEVEDSTNMEEMLETRSGHEEVMRQLQKIFRKMSFRTLSMSGESCAICRECVYPKEPCRYPDQMIPCMEAYGIVVPLLAETAGIAFHNGSNVITWFGVVLLGPA